MSYTLNYESQYMYSDYTIENIKHPDIIIPIIVCIIYIVGMLYIFISEKLSRYQKYDSATNKIIKKNIDSIMDWCYFKLDTCNDDIEINWAVTSKLKYLDIRNMDYDKTDSLIIDIIYMNNYIQDRCLLNINYCNELYTMHNSINLVTNIKNELIYMITDSQLYDIKSKYNIDIYETYNGALKICIPLPMLDNNKLQSMFKID